MHRKSLEAADTLVNIKEDNNSNDDEKVGPCSLMGTNEENDECIRRNSSIALLRAKAQQHQLKIKQQIHKF